ncbi:MAG: transcription-repair coupling factor, partial [Alistipes sp.]|nr:transcription-repair coupling factor [Alistipes sp.]
MEKIENILKRVEGSKPFNALLKEHRKKSVTVHLDNLVGGALSLYSSALITHAGGVHIFVAEDRDAAAYMLNDFYALLDEDRVHFFPTSYKRSILYGKEDAQGVVQRTNTLNAIRHHKSGYIVVCTYPEALAERVADERAITERSIRLKVGDMLRISDLEELLVESGFQQVDFVYEPGQYSLRGGIVDVFSYSENRPFRIDFFGDEIDSIRRFNISSQLSHDKVEQVEIIPNMNTSEVEKVSLVRFAGESTCWFYDAEYVLKRVNDLRRKVLGEMEEPSKIDTLLTSRNGLLQDMTECRMCLLRDNLKERVADVSIPFATTPQPKFNKKFDILADDMEDSTLKGYKTYILSESKAQIERLDNIFHQMGRRNIEFDAIAVTLHEGFVDNGLKLCLYTDHQIFDRYRRYRINGEIKRDEQMTVAELNALKMGDYVVHIDHGVGRFGGLVKINENGKLHEAIKLVYKDNDVLFVNVHSLHRISRYKSGEGEPPKIYKLGNGAWQKLKATTKKAV